MVDFIGTCVGLPARDLDNYDDSARDITYRTFRKYVGSQVTSELNENFSVPVGRDYAVSFSKGKWRGKRAVCMMHSSIHHIWTVN